MPAKLVDKPYIAFIASTSCTIQTLFTHFTECGRLYYIHPAKAKKETQRYGYAKFGNEQAAEKALTSVFLHKYHC